MFFELLIPVCHVRVHLLTYSVWIRRWTKNVIVLHNRYYHLSILLSRENTSSKDNYLQILLIRTIGVTIKFFVTMEQSTKTRNIKFSIRPYVYTWNNFTTYINILSISIIISKFYLFYFVVTAYENKYAFRFFTSNLMVNQNIIKVCTGKECYICCKLFENTKQRSWYGISKVFALF